MLSSRNIHFAILGVIIGATFGYIFAFYQVQKTIPPMQPFTGVSSNGHPDVSNEQMIGMFDEALKKDPENEELLTRYGNFLFDIEKYPDAIDKYQKVLKINPKNIDVQTDMGTAYLNVGNPTQALEEYKKSLQANPNHILTLHNLFIYDIDVVHDLDGATEVLARMEKADPQYQPLASLRQKLAQEKSKK